jgi:hypothetical protein
MVKLTRMSEKVIALVSCRICTSHSLVSRLNFGEICLTGVFEIEGDKVRRAKMELGQCLDCGLVQLMDSYPTDWLYGETYGYESHLNAEMVKHLTQKANFLSNHFLYDSQSYRNKIVVDIASNDGTFLSKFDDGNLVLVGIDPLAEIVSDLYPANSVKIPNFFSADLYWATMKDPADLVTSLSVIYDLDDPVRFASDVNSILKDGGIWHLEQSYLPTMCDTLSYDTICHEHLLYLTLHDIQRILVITGFKILNVSLNSVNGGSIAVTAIKTNAQIEGDPFTEFLLTREISEGYLDGTRIQKFVEDSKSHRLKLLELIIEYKRKGYDVVGLGASTKGNVLLQWLNLDCQIISKIGDVNPRKFGKRTPGTNIPIISELELLNESNNRTVALVLPWHFRSGIQSNCEKLVKGGGRFLFPLPHIEVVSS